MGSFRRLAVSRSRWLALFAVLLLGVSAVPVLADPPPTEPPPPGEVNQASPEEAQKLPDASDIAEGMREIEENEVAEERWLESSEAEHQREESLFSYANASAPEAVDLLDTFFAEQLELLDQDPARAISDATLDRVLGATEAKVTVDGVSMLLEGASPIRVTNDDGELRKVDLDLAPVDGGLAPANPLVEVSLPGSSSGEMTVGEEGLAIAPVLTKPANEARLLAGENVQYHETQEATDLIAAPLGAGLELFSLLRSAESPEELRFEVTLPPGAELRLEESGGAEVVRGNEQLARIPAPTALDAQGSDVPVTMRIEGTTLVLAVSHREGQFAYPLLVDPAIVENWYDGNNWWWGQSLAALEPATSPWIWATNNGGRFWAGTHHIYHQWNGSDRGLFISGTDTTGAQPANQLGQFTYTVPGANSYIGAVLISPFWRDDHGCTDLGKYPEPHDYTGLWSDAWGWATFHRDWAHSYGYGIEQPSTQLAPQDMWREKTGQVFVLGMGTGNGTAAKMPCWRDIYAGGVAIFLDDLSNPNIGTVTGIPSGWFSDTPPLSINVPTNDGGLGVRRVTITNQGKALVAQDNVGGCTGLRSAMCPAGRNSVFTPTANSFGEGIRTGAVNVEDPTGKTASVPIQTMVDRSVPEVTLSGQLAEATEEVGSEEPPAPEDGAEKLRLPVYKLTIKATDGSKESPLTKRSGVKNIEVFLDGKKMQVPWVPKSSCPETSCEKKETYTLGLGNIETAGSHTLQVKAIDFAENVKTRDIEFEYFPATGMRDEYVMHYFPLPDGVGDESNEEHPARPELAVNVMNGNLVYRELDLDIKGAAVDLEVERYYNSMLPDSENTEWGDGWTLAQTPQLDPEEAPSPSETEIVDSSGAVDGGIELPTQAGGKEFDPELQATLTKEADGGYELTDETGESATSVAFNEDGRAEALRTEGYAKVDYDYEGGELVEIAVQDPATFAADPEELEIPEAEPIAVPTYASSFGSNGSGNGQFKSPGDVAIDSVGNLWVADKSNNRVQKLNAKGEFLTKFGSSGTGNGQFSGPSSIAIDPKGNLWVADKSNNRIQKFDPSGNFLLKFGSSGTGNGQFSLPESIAVDAKGNVWVCDTGNGRIQKFSEAGEFIKVIGSKGSGNGQFGECTGIDVSPDGRIWAGDWIYNRVNVFSEAGEFLFKFGSSGSGNGQFSHPDAVEVDAVGNVWVGDQSNHRIQQFDSEGKYVRQFGSLGSGPGQFSFTYPMGIETDSKGHLWVADVNNHRVQQWLVPIQQPTYASAFGSNGSGDGQLKSPGDVAVGLGGSLWVVDKSNNRIQKFSSNGQFLAKFGSYGTGNGQFNRPASIAVDRDGNLLVADANNNRIQKFDPSGNFLLKFGSSGTGNGQFSLPESIAVDAKGNVWVCDTGNGRIQKFSEAGEFIKVIGSKGSGNGQFGECTGIDVSPDGRIWAGDWIYNRVNVFSEAGEFLFKFGSSGSGNGQFSHPDAVEVDAVGNVWVGDQSNHRIQQFDSEGKYVRQFGSLGSGPGQFSFTYPMGIETDSKGHLWVADVNNHRVQQWLLANYAPVPAVEVDVTDGDPQVTIETEGGLVSSVEGNAAGEHTYEHEGDFLVAHEGPLGETTYEKDGAGRLTKITLPNDTWAAIEYEATYGRVTKVTVDPAGSEPAKSTEFNYFDDPRRTIVIPPGAPHLNYDIGADGSVLKWWNTQKPPELDLAGTLYDNREKPQAISSGDYSLEARAESAEGIASIQILVNGNQLISEQTCEQTSEPGIECDNEPIIDEWITSTNSHPPGHLDLKVITTDRNGESTSESFWVDIPQPLPPPAPGSPIPPTFSEIAEFREEYGFEVVFPVKNETQLNERIFDLINAWYEGDSVARSTTEKWGVPLRPADVAELEYREQYLDQAATTLPQWVLVHAASAGYAGFYVDHRQGGKLFVGFKTGQTEHVNELKQPGVLMAPADRVKPFPTQPPHSLKDLETLQLAVSDAPTNGAVTQVGIDIPTNRVTVGANNVNQVKATLESLFGQQAPTTVYSDQSEGPAPRSRERYTGRIKAGDTVRSKSGQECTAGYGAWDIGGRGADGLLTHRHFLLVAGHCFFTLGQQMLRWQWTPDGKNLVGEENPMGFVRRTNFTSVGDGFMVDASAVRLENPDVAPRLIYTRYDQSVRISDPIIPYEGMIVCHSGKTSNRPKCGAVVKPPVAFRYRKDGPRMWQVPFKAFSLGGDSGGPVWQPGTGRAVGSMTAGEFDETIETSYITPLLLSPARPAAPGILSVLGTPEGALNLVKWKD